MILFFPNLNISVSKWYNIQFLDMKKLGFYQDMNS